MIRETEGGPVDDGERTYPEELAHVADEQKADAHWPPVTIKIDGPQGAGKTRLAELLRRILFEASVVDNEAQGGTVHVMGYVDGPIEEFLDALTKAEAEVARLADAMHDSEDDRYKAQLQADENLAIVDALAKRLAEVEGRKLALGVAHGDIAPEAYENRRRVVADGIGQIIAAVRAGFRQRVNSQNQAMEARSR